MRLRCFAVWMAFFSAVGQGLASDTPLATRPSTPAEMEAARKRIIELYKALPMEDQPVMYVPIDGKLVPAQVDPNANIEYRWRGVALDPSQIPRFGYSGSFGLHSSRATGLEVREMDAPTRYLPIPGTKRFRAGYYDKSNAIVYQWDGVELTAEELPRNADIKGLIIDSSAVEDISPVEPPPQFRTAVTKPKPEAATLPTANASPRATPITRGTLSHAPDQNVRPRVSRWYFAAGLAVIFLIVLAALAVKRRS